MFRRWQEGSVVFPRHPHGAATLPVAIFRIICFAPHVVRLGSDRLRRVDVCTREFSVQKNEQGMDQGASGGGVARVPRNHDDGHFGRCHEST